MRRFFMVLPLLCLTTGAVAAEDNYPVYGEGIMSCGRWVTERKADTPLAHMGAAWVRGFFSAVNATKWAFGTKPGPTIESDAMMVWLDNYCQAHPLEGLAKAALQLELETKPAPSPSQ